MERVTVQWGTEVVEGEYAGHRGRLYEHSPSSILSILAEATRWTGRDYVVQGDRRIKHDEFVAAIPVAADLLAQRGVKPGDRVMLLSYNSPEFMLATWATWWLGAVPVYANRWWSTAELDHATVLTEPSVVVSDVPDLITAGRAVDISDLTGAYGHSTSALDAHPVEDIDSPALILFTSGSSGAPKAVVLSHRSVIVNQHNLLARSRRLPHLLDDAAPQPVTLVCTPLFHIGGVSNILTNLITGGRLVLTRGKFDPGEILGLIQEEGVQSWGGVPTMATRLLEHPDFDAYDLSTLRSFPLGGAPLPGALLERMVRKLPQLKKRGLANTWGMTESGGFVTVAGNADLEKYPGTVGRPYPCVELRIDDPDAKGSGEILVRSPTVMLGYLGLDDGTVDNDGWLRTGDLGHINEEGFLFLDGRSKDIVIRGGENIACVHVEKVLLDHPRVVEVAIFGVPHEDLGEELVAAVTYRPGTPVDADELREHCRARLAYFEVPTRWLIDDRPLPTLAGEKLNKKAIREAFLASRAGG
ncbi:AMP-dependent synthetase [Rhodococcus rhodochrous KG-21]|uniref:AMP-dependent synthetase n=1 Tax=Rhodococcus rhodochrous KG-21 TaxID=1441923 RepID=A0A0M9WQW2_RHORH|nr:AMP-dependent synthetase [Rhodococcus rhodochrous KG-21]